MSWSGPCRGHTGDFFFLDFFLVASSSEGLAAWFDPLICTDLADWWCSPDYLFFCFGDFLHPASGIFPQQFRGSHRTRRALWGLGLRSWTLVLWVIFATPFGLRNLPSQGYHLLVGFVPPQREGTSRGTLPYCRCGRWNIGSWCCGVFTPPSWGTSSGAGLPWE